MHARWFLLVSCLLVVPACRLGPPLQPELDRSRRITRFSFIEEGRLVILIVGVDAARFRHESGFVPLLVAVGNKGVPSPLRITRESFTLVDPDGNPSGLAPYTELLRGYRLQALDRKLLGDRGFLETKFDLYRRIPANFFPVPGGRGVRQDRVELPRHTYMDDVLYFPMPEGGLRNRRFDLFLRCRPLQEAVFVTFEVP